MARISGTPRSKIHCRQYLTRADLIIIVTAVFVSCLVEIVIVVHRDTTIVALVVTIDKSESCQSSYELLGIEPVCCWLLPKEPWKYMTDL